MDDAPRNAHGPAIALRALLALLSMAVALSACSSRDPSIKALTWQVLMVEGPTRAFDERLSFFAWYDDADGDADFSSIELEHLDTGLVWTLSGDDVVCRLKGRDRWIGSNNLASPREVGFPDGTYEVTVYDLAGNESSKTFMLAKPSLPRVAPARFSLEGETWTVERNPAVQGFSRVWFLLFNNQRELKATWLVPEPREGTTMAGSLTTLRTLARDAVSVQCLIENPSSTAGVLLTPVDLE
jgi:hypothetical protein